MSSKAAFVLHGYVPDRKLLPNNRRSTRSDGDKRRRQRLDVAMMLAAQPSTLVYRTHDTFRVQITVCWPRELVIAQKGPNAGKVAWRFKPLPDGDNLNSAMKGLVDALADKLGVNDKFFDLLPPKQLRDETGDGYTLIEVEVQP
jgi:hypothetical protein